MAIELRQDAQDEQIAILHMDVPGSSVNVINEQFIATLDTKITTLQKYSNFKGVVLTSGKKSWMAGADLNRLLTRRDAAYLFRWAEDLKALFRRLETLGRPVVAAINGSALGGGLELALACHYRVAINDPAIQFGFPEVGLGLLPGAGGVARTVRLIGLERGLEWLSRNKRFSPVEALGAGIINALVEGETELLDRARSWLHGSAHAHAPWDEERLFRIPGGGPDHPKNAQLVGIAPAMIRQETRGNYPAPQAILAAAVEGSRVDFSTACRIESRYFARLASGPVAHNMITSLWFHLNEIKKERYRPQAIPRQKVKNVGIIGAGKMGQGIAYVAAKAGFPVVLLDISAEKTAAAVAKIEQIIERAAQRTPQASAGRAALIHKITPSTDYGALSGCDLIIETVVEDRRVKSEVYRQAAAKMAPDALLASNTSAMPINSLATAVARPSQFIGLHFFSPVERMKLVEIVIGAASDPAIVAQAFDFVRAIGKLPILVNDGRGFYTTRVFSGWLREGLAMVAEGREPAAIEMAGLQAGMPAGPLAMVDELSLPLVEQIRRQTMVDLRAAGETPPTHPGDEVITVLLQEGRHGRVNGAGFYDYLAAGKRLWPELRARFQPETPPRPLAQKEMIDRLLYIQAVETARCLDEGVLRSEAEANIGSIFGWGFPACHGGTMQFIRAVGPRAFTTRARELARNYGDRFLPPPIEPER